MRVRLMWCGQRPCWRTHKYWIHYHHIIHNILVSSALRRRRRPLVAFDRRVVRHPPSTRCIHLTDIKRLEIIPHKHTHIHTRTHRLSIRLWHRRKRDVNADNEQDADSNIDANISETATAPILLAASSSSGRCGRVNVSRLVTWSRAIGHGPRMQQFDE